MDNGYHRRAGDQAQVAQPAKQNGQSRMSFTTRKLVPEFHSKRQIPGGPDGQHHGSNGRWIELSLLGPDLGNIPNCNVITVPKSISQIGLCYNLSNFKMFRNITKVSNHTVNNKREKL